MRSVTIASIAGIIIRVWRRFLRHIRRLQNHIRTPRDSSDRHRLEQDACNRHLSPKVNIEQHPKLAVLPVSIIPTLMPFPVILK